MRKPEEIVIEVTTKCNLSCSFCFAKNYKPASREMKTKDITFLMDRIADFGVPIVRFTGGEPLLRDDIFEIIRYANTKGLRVWLNTNGLLITDENAKLLNNYVENILISFHSLENYDKIMKASRLLDGMSVLRFGTMATNMNIDNLEVFSNIIEKTDAKRWEIYRPMPPSESMTHNDVKNLVEKLLHFETNKTYLIANPLPFCSYDPDKVDKVSLGAECDDGHNRVIISSDGLAKPSYLITKCIGNPFEQTMEEIWNNEFVVKIRNLDFAPNECKGCVYLKKCKGGSRYIANMAYKSYASPDPLAQPEKYSDKLYKTCENTILGLDIGGSNIKYAVLNKEKNKLRYRISPFKFSSIFPEKRKNELETFLKKMNLDADTILVITTAPLAFMDYSKGLETVLDIVENVFGAKILVMDMNGKFLHTDEAKKHVFGVALREYVGTVYLAKKIFGLDDFILVDTGTTSTSIIPVKDGKVVHLSMNDKIYQRMSTGELCWQGIIYTPVNYIIDSLPYEGKTFQIRALSELLSGDILFLLDKIPENFYKKYRNFEKEHILYMIANLPMADRSILNKKEIMDFANYIYHKQIEKIMRCIEKVKNMIPTNNFILAGSGAEILARPVAKDFGKVYSLSELGKGLEEIAPLLGAMHLYLDRN